MKAETETGTCPLCGDDDPTLSPYRQDPFRVVRCKSCMLWYLSPRLTADAMSKFYKGDSYFSGDETGYVDYSRQENSLRLTFRRLLRKMASLGMTGGRLLEVGSGLGYFLDEAREFFDHRSGVELSPEAAAFAATLSGATMYESVAALPRQSQFDSIVALHVIEHVYQPVSFLRLLGDHIRPGGMLVLAAPDMGSFWRHAMGRHWPSFKYPEHVSFFDNRTLPKLVADAGFSDPLRLSYLHDFPVSEILGKFGLKTDHLPDRLRLSLPATTICYAAKRPVALAA